MKSPQRSGSSGEIEFNSDELKAMEAGPRPPFRVTSHWMSLMDGTANDPLRRQVVPGTAEWSIESGELTDPLGEELHSPLPRLIRRYKDRALVVVTGECALYCRHCFRRRLTGEDYGRISAEETNEIGKWLTGEPDVKELLLSGGDPLTLKDRELMYLIDVIRRHRPDIVMRLATRMPIVEPSRITASLARKLGRRRPLWVVLQANHSRELSPPAIKAISRLQENGLALINQSVLLRGVNDDVDTLEALSRSLVSAGVKPYYLFQGDVAAGTGHFRVPLSEARDLVNELRGRVSGLAMPNFAVDLPGGGGKVPLNPDYVDGREAGGWRMHTPDGREGLYPDPDRRNDEQQ